MASWESRATLPADRHNGAYGVIANKLYIAGGAGSTAGGYLDTCIVYNPDTDSWGTFASLPETVGLAGSGVVSGKLYVAGGNNGATRIQTTRVYTPATDSWATLSNMPTARDGMAAAAYNGKLYVFGGGISGGSADAITTVEVYDVAGDSWTTATAMPAARAHARAAVIGNYIYMVGGGSNRNFTLGTAYDSLYRYDPAGDSWTTLTSMPTARRGPNVIAFNGKLYVAGGRDAGNTSLNTFEEYDPATDSWSTLTVMTTARSSSATGLLGTKYFHVAGGFVASGSTSHHRYSFDLTIQASGRFAYVDATLNSAYYGVVDIASKTKETGWPSLGTGSAQSISWSPDGTRIAVALSVSPYLKIIDVASKTVESGWPTLAGLCRGIAWSPDGTRLACYGDVSPYLQVITVSSKTIETGWATASAAPSHWGRTLAWSAGGGRLALFKSSASPGYDIYDVASKSQETGWPAVTQNFSITGAFSPDNERLAVLSGTATAAQRLFVILVSSKTVESGWPTFSTASFSCRGISWSADGTQLAIGRVGSTGVNHLQVINVASKALESDWPAGSSDLDTVSFSPEEGYLLAGYSNGGPMDLIETEGKFIYAPPWVGTFSSAATDFSWFPILRNVWRKTVSGLASSSTSMGLDARLYPFKKRTVT